MNYSFKNSLVITLIAISTIFLSISCKTRQKTLKVDEAKQSKLIKLDFPYDVLGYWKGEIEIFQGNNLAMTVPMALIIEETSDESAFRWEIIYNEGEKEDRRPYVLLMHDTISHHYKIDEDNGIILDCYLLGNKLISTFSVSGSTLTTINTFLDDEMVFEVIMGPQESINTTGNLKIGEEEIPPVDSYKVSTYQRAICKRIRG